MTALKNDRFLRALLRRPVDAHPLCGRRVRLVATCLKTARSRAKAGDLMKRCA